MIDLSKGPFVFGKSTPAEVLADLQQALPAGAVATAVGRQALEIRVRQGLWRGARLYLQADATGTKLVRYRHLIPSFAAKVILFLVSVAVLSAVIMLVLAAVLGEFIPGIFGLGGAAGVAMYSIVERLVLASVNATWVPALHGALERTGAAPSIVASGVAELA